MCCDTILISKHASSTEMWDYMKFCRNCGTQLEDNAVFCENCGAKVEAQNVEQNMTDQGANENSDQNQEMHQNTNPSDNIGNMVTKAKDFIKKINVKIWIVIAAVIVVIIVGVVIVSNMSKRINVNDYITVKFDGYNTVGTASCDFDEEGFMKAVLNKNGIKMDKLSDLTGKNLEKAQKLLRKVDNYSDIDYDLDKKSDLSNGNKVKLTIDIDENISKALGVKLIGKTKEYTVSDLKEAQTIDPFEYVTVTYSGISPNATVSIKINDDADSYIKTMHFQADKTQNIAVGDKITVSVKTEEATAAKHGYILSETSKEYECSKADQYITDITKISEDKLKSIQKEATDKIESYYAGFNSKYNVQYSNLTYDGSYVLEKKNSSYGNDNIVYLIYSATISADGDKYSKGIESTKIYMPVKFNDVVLKADESIKYNTYTSIVGQSSLSVGWNAINGYTEGDKMFKELITANKDSYTYQVDGNVIEFGK